MCTFDPRDCAFLSADTAYVQVRGVQPTYGRIVCPRWIGQDSWSDCTLSLEELELYNVPLPALARDPSWLPALEGHLHRTESWLRAWTQFQ